MTPAQLGRLCSQPKTWLDPLMAGMLSYDINEGNRQAMFLATCLYESAAFTSLSENLNYNARGLLRVWPSRFTIDTANSYANRPEAIANRVYANRNGNGDESSGDGWRFRGGGLIQLTGRENFAQAQDATGYAVLDHPELLQTPEAACAVAAWFWDDNGCNEVADEADFEGTQGIVNRGLRTKIADNMTARLDWLRKVRAALL